MHQLLKSQPDTDAIFCINDDLALGALFECRAQRLDVPGRMGIVGFNDFEMMAATEPSVTSVKTRRYEMGRRAAEMVLRRLRHQDPGEKVVDIGFELVERDSTRRSRGAALKARPGKVNPVFLTNRATANVGGPGGIGLPGPDIHLRPRDLRQLSI